MTSEQTRNLILISHPRTTSNLLVKILNIEEQHEILKFPSDQNTTHMFWPAVKVKFEQELQAKRICDWSEAEIETMNENTQKRLKELNDYAARAGNEGKIAFFREHSIALADPVTQLQFYTGDTSGHQIPWPFVIDTRSPLNKTILPDEFMKRWLPTFVIRHPALTFPSFYRVLHASDSTEDEKIREAALVNTYTWTRNLWDYYSITFDVDGIILDADDINSRPEMLVNYCETVGLDPSKLKFTWEAKLTAEELQQLKDRDSAHRPFMSTMDASSGIMKSKVASQVDMDQETVKWREEFGERAGTKMEEWVIAAIPDYEYLHSRRFKN